jgi:DNA polymerase III gamma/tau subunit
LQPAAQPAAQAVQAPAKAPVQPAVQQAVQQAAQKAAKQAKPAAQPQSVLEALLLNGAAAAPQAEQPAAHRPAQALHTNGNGHVANGKKNGFALYATSQADVERNLLKEADSRPPSGPQAGLLADPEAGRFLLMQLKGPETIAREDGKKLLNHLKMSFDREDERKATRFMKLVAKEFV